MRLTRPVIIGVVVAVVAIIAWLLLSSRAGSQPTNESATRWTPLPREVRVEVLNSGKVIGAARIGTLLLRHAGLDVVYSGNADSALSGRAHNQIMVRMGDTTGVGRIREALGGAEVVEQRDTTRLVDLTVLLGRDFAPPPDRLKGSP